MQGFGLDLGAVGEVQLPILSSAPVNQRSTPTGNGTTGYRQREATKYRGVTKTSGTNSGVEKYDVQFVFCDGGTKKHPKIYGFPSPLAASRAFDILTCRRMVEKGKALAEFIEAGQVPVLNHPITDYAGHAFERLVAASSRDDIIYGLKQAAKRGYELTATSMYSEMIEAIAMATRDAEERMRLGDPRQSYEPTAAGAPAAERKRRATSNAGGGGRGRRRRSELAGSGGAVASTGMDPTTLQLPGSELAGLSLLPIGGADAFGQNFLLSHLLASASGTAQALPGLLPMPGAGPLSPDKPSGGVAGGDGAGPGTERPSDGLSFVQELCRLAAQTINHELVCAADLLRMWEVMQKGERWDSQQYTLPHPLYDAYVEAVGAAADLPAALALVHGMWQRRILSNLFSMYIASLTGVQLLPEAEAGAADADAEQGNFAGPSNVARHPAADAALPPAGDGQGGDAGSAAAAEAAAQAAMLQQPVFQALIAAQMAAVAAPGKQLAEGDAAADLTTPAVGHDQVQQFQNQYYASLQSGDATGILGIPPGGGV